MATTWLLPVAVIVLKGFRETRVGLPALALCAAGLATAGLPDYVLEMFPLVARFKYVAAEVLCLVGLLGVWGARTRGARGDRQKGPL